MIYNDKLTKLKEYIKIVDGESQSVGSGKCKAELGKLIGVYENLIGCITTSPPPDDLGTSVAMAESYEKQINSKVSELRTLLNEAEPLTFSRDPSDAGTIGGNGTVIFRTNGKGFSVQSGTLMQSEIEQKNKNGSSSILKP